MTKIKLQVFIFISRMVIKFVKFLSYIITIKLQSIYMLRKL
jgi:hypothetical protein